MKNDSQKIRWIIFCILTGLSVFFAFVSMAEQAGKSAPVSKLKRYVDKAIGFSIEYDAKKLTKDLGPVGPFVFRRDSAEGMPSLGITAGPFPAGTALADTANLISGSLPRMIPGCLIHNVNNQRLIKLTDGSEANYFELDLNIGGTESMAAFVTAKKNDRLIVFGTVDTQGGSMENLSAMVKSLRLDVEVDEAVLKAKGFAKDGKFTRTESPAFTLEYPNQFQNRVLQSNQIFRAGIPRGSPSMSIAISALREGKDINYQLKALAEGYAISLKSVGTDIKIVSQNPIKTYKLFDAYQIQIVWRWRGHTPLTTVVDIIEKENKAILLAGHTIYDIDELLDIFKTINLNP